MLRLFLVLLSIIPTVAFSQNYPQNYFESPVNIPLALSGTFGELRSNHFHAGVDIKTQGKEGLPVFASASGQIVRIKVSAYGYGNALYLAHPNGFTTVYAHLKNFSPEVEDWVKQQQYAKKQFEVNLFPPAGKFNVKKGSEIARSGNSGGSGGPHLHFEIRDSKTEEIINPALFGLPISDKRRPSIYHLYAKPISTGALVNGSSTLREIKLVNQGNGNYSGEISGSGFIGMIIHSIDKQDLSENKNGIYKIEQFANDTLNYVFTTERFAFSETRYINAHMDFERKMNYKQMLHKCYVEPGNKLSMYSNIKNRGLIELKSGDIKIIKLVIYDSWGNTNTIDIAAKGVKSATMQTKPENLLEYKSAHTIKMDGVKVYMPSNTLYWNEVIAIKQLPACSACETAVFQIGETTIPAHKRYEISMHKDQLKHHDKLVWAVLDEKGRASGLTTKWNGDWLTAKPKYFGKFTVMQDTTAPVLRVNPIKSETVKAGNRISMKATDNLSGVTFYQAQIDGNWVLLKHDAKRNYYWHEFEDNLAPGKHDILFTFKDEVGNITSQKIVFSYQP